MKELARVKAAERPVTAVDVRRAPCGHALMSVHPLGGREFLVWRRPGRVTGRVRDSEQWQRDGAGSPGLDEAGFAPLPELALIVSGPDADSARELLGIDFPVLACSCGLVPVRGALADEIHASLTQWWTESRARPSKPKIVIAT